MTDAIALRDGTARPPRVLSRQKLRQLALAGAALAIGLGGTWLATDWWTVGRYVETTDDAYVGGNVTAIAPHVGGFIAAILVADNQPVRAGQLLVRLDQRDFDAALQRATAVVAGRAAELETLRARNVLQQSTIRQQEADLAAKMSRAAFAAQEAERYRSLAQTSVGSKQDAERTATLDQEARSGVTAATAALEAARQQLKVLEAQIATAQAAQAEARSELQTAQLNLGYTELRAPVDGYVGNRAAQVGSYVAAGAYLLSVIPAANLWVDANFKEDQLARMKPGQGATVVADLLPDRPFHGRILSLAPGTGALFSVIPPENATGNFTKIVQRVPVRIALDPADANLAMLRPGLSITASVDTRFGKDAPP